MTCGKHHEGRSPDSDHEEEQSVQALSVDYARQVLRSELDISKPGSGGLISTC